MRALGNAALALALTAAAATAQAGIKASAVLPGTSVVPSPAEYFVPLDNTSATTLTFNLSSAGKKVLTYSALCAVQAPAGDGTAFLDLDIYVNGVVVDPTVGNRDAFCSASGTGDLDGWVRASITVPIQGIAGTNTVRVKARGTFNTTWLFLSDAALLIFD
jgi:hypothetical protein